MKKRFQSGGRCRCRRGEGGDCGSERGECSGGELEEGSDTVTGSYFGMIPRVSFTGAKIRMSRTRM
jgi:hypothetical protein